MIETKEDLRNWFIGLKLPSDGRLNGLAMEYWEKALCEPTVGKIRAFYVLGCVDMWCDDEIAWTSIAFGVK